MSDQPGEADPRRTPATRGSAWRVYASVVAAIQIVSLFYTLPKLDVWQSLDYGVTLVGTVGLFGFVYGRPLLRRWVWVLWSVLFPAWDVVMGLWVYPRVSGSGIQPAYFIAMAIFLPQYLGVIRYAFRSPDLWTRTG